MKPVKNIKIKALSKEKPARLLIIIGILFVLGWGAVIFLQSMNFDFGSYQLINKNDIIINKNSDLDKTLQNLDETNINDLDKELNQLEIDSSSL